MCATLPGLNEISRASFLARLNWPPSNSGCWWRRFRTSNRSLRCGNKPRRTSSRQPSAPHSPCISNCARIKWKIFLLISTRRSAPSPRTGRVWCLFLSGPTFGTQRARIADLAIQHHLPTMFTFNYYVEAGGLMSYGVDPLPIFRRAASLVAKILRGAKPSDLPVEQPTNFEFTLNLKTAKALGVSIPTSILLRADEVIE